MSDPVSFSTLSNRRSRWQRKTYDAFMQLEAPRDYWAKKRDEHATGKERMAWIFGIVAIFSVIALAIAAWLLLPQNHPANTIPWRQIGFFFLASTFLIWLNRLMLSHIHLYVDAREREVMTSTFLTLVQRQESREGLKKEDIALMLAPIFRPSTNGVIKTMADLNPLATCLAPRQGNDPEPYSLH